MIPDRKKYVAQDFLRRFCAATEEKARFEAALEEFRGSTSEMRREVGNGLLSIASDRSESTFQRGFALCALAVMARICEVGDDSEFEDALSDLVEHPTGNAGGRRSDLDAAWDIRYRALIALIGINRKAGLQKVEYLLKYYAESDFAKDLRELRDRFSDGAQGSSEGLP